jgi:hypothetical protein
MVASWLASDGGMATSTWTPYRSQVWEKKARSRENRKSNIPQPSSPFLGKGCFAGVVGAVPAPIFYLRPDEGGSRDRMLNGNEKNKSHANQALNSECIGQEQICSLYNTLPPIPSGADAATHRCPAHQSTTRLTLFAPPLCTVLRCAAASSPSSDRTSYSPDPLGLSSPLSRRCTLIAGVAP